MVRDELQIPDEHMIGADFCGRHLRFKPLSLTNHRIDESIRGKAQVAFVTRRFFAAFMTTGYVQYAYPSGTAGGMFGVLCPGVFWYSEHWSKVSADGIIPSICRAHPVKPRSTYRIVP